MKRYFYVILWVLFFPILILAQDNSFNRLSNKSYIPSSPTVGALGTFGKTPISLYNGTANIVVPIHTVSFKELQLPITLQYVAGNGIRPNEVPGNAGLGFALKAGGVITRIVNGSPDGGNYATNVWDSKYYKWADGKYQPALYNEETIDMPPGTKLPAGFSEISRTRHVIRGSWGRGPITSREWDVVTYTQAKPYSYSPLEGTYYQNPFDPDFLGMIGDWQSESFSTEYLLRGFHRLNNYTKNLNYIDDTDPDEWLFNFNGYTGSFIMDHNGIFRIKSQNSPDFKIKFYYQRDAMIPLPLEEQDPSGPTVGPQYVDSLYKQILLQAIELTDQDGIIYRFGGDNTSIEFSRPGISRDNSAAIPNIGGLVEPSGWMLTSITSPNGYSINLEYERDSFVIEKKEYTEAIKSEGLPTGSRYTSSQNNFQGNRIEVATLINPVLLARIKTPTERIEFFHKPFYNQLDYVQSVGDNSNQDNFFYYVDVRFPKRMTMRMPKAIDFLHFYNNEGSIYKRAFFSYDFSSQKRLKLQEFTVRDGYGRKFSYSFDYNGEQLPAYLAGMEDIYGYYNAVSPLLAEKSEAVLDYFLAADSTLRTAREQEYIFSRRIVPEKAGAEMLSKITYPTGGFTTFEYQANDFSRSAREWPFTIEINNSEQSKLTGGVRIWKIKDYQANNEIVESRVFHYIRDFQDGGHISSGVSAFTPVFFEEFSGPLHDPAHPYYSANNLISMHNYTINYWRWNSNPILPLNNSRGSHISYSEITEEVEGKGYITHKFQNYDNGYNDSPPLSYASDNDNLKNFNSYDQGISFELERGLPKEKIVMDIDKSTLTKESFVYNDSPVRFEDYVKRIVSTVNPLDKDYITSMRATTSKIYTYHPYLRKHYITTYTPNGNIEEEITYSYNFRKVTEELKRQSNGNSKITNFKYPFDFTVSSTDIFGNMLSKNMVSLVHERKEINNSSEERKTRFGYGENNYIHPNAIDRKVGAGDYYTEYEVIQHDGYGNPIEVRSLEGVTVVNIWGYKGQYLIGHIENADYTTVIESLGGSQILDELNAPDVSSILISTVFNRLRKNLDNSKVSHFTYEVPLGITSKTDPIGISEYYSYDGLGRLASITDQKGNLIKTYCYNFKGESVDCNRDISYSNSAISRDFYKNDCQGNYYGEKVTYSVAAGKYTGMSQFIADQMALNELDAQGQLYANQHGTCKPRGVFADFFVTPDIHLEDGAYSYEEHYVVLYSDEYHNDILSDDYNLNYTLSLMGNPPVASNVTVQNGFHSFGYFNTYDAYTSNVNTLMLNIGGNSYSAGGARDMNPVLDKISSKMKSNLIQNGIILPVNHSETGVLYYKDNKGLYLKCETLEYAPTEVEACQRLSTPGNSPIDFPDAPGFFEGTLFDLISGELYTVLLDNNTPPIVPGPLPPLFLPDDIAGTLAILTDGYYVSYEYMTVYRVLNGKIAYIKKCN